MRTLIQLCSPLVRTWWFWAFVLLAVPNCGLPFDQFECNDPNGCSDGGGGQDCPPQGCDCPNGECPCDPKVDTCPCDPATDPDGCMTLPDTTFQPGSDPTDAIMCDIPVPVADPVLDNCATAAEAADPLNLPTTAAATALWNGQHSSFALDFSASAEADCSGQPKKVTYLSGSFPDGATVCINCTSQIPAVYATTTKACIAKCVDLLATLSSGFMPADKQAWCESNAHTSVNYDKNNCDPRFHGACVGGTPDPAFVDPRRAGEPIQWTDLINVSNPAGTTDLSQTTPDSGTTQDDFAAGAASDQIIISGDAWVDFEATTNDKAHVVGFRESRSAGDVECDNAFDCPDTDPSLSDIGFGLGLGASGNVFVAESSPAINIIVLTDTYLAGDLFRVHVRDLHNGMAEISYAKITGACNPGAPCPENVFYTSVATPRFPLRVDASFREQGAQITNVNLVRIQQ